MQQVLRLFLFLFFFSINQTEAQNRYTTFEIDAPQLQTKKKIWVYLPLNYEKSTQKYPVIYMHDAQNLFDAAASFGGEWNIDETLDSLKAKVGEFNNLMQQMIIFIFVELWKKSTNDLH